MTTRHDAIFEWKMTGPEADAYKLAVIWEEEVHKRIPDYVKTPEWRRRNSIPKKGDPRRGNLFKHCWKLRRSTRGLMKEEEYREYILANVMMLVSKNLYCEVNTICGDNAWIRWKMWRRRYERKVAESRQLPPPPITETKVAREILRTKQFLFEKCDGEPTKEKIDDYVSRGIFKTWILRSKISMYYVVLSPFLKEHVQTLSEECVFDPSLFIEKATDDTSRFFEYEFNHEFAA